MGRGILSAFILLVSGAVLAGRSAAAEPVAAERGRKALLEHAYNPPSWSKEAYDQAWRQWGDATQAPAAYAEAFRERYGLHPAPFPNGGYPMGLRESTFLLRKTISNDCLLCHGGSIAGQSYVGLGNAALEIQALFEDLNAADGRAKKTPFVFGNVRGTNEAGSMAVFLLAFREPDLTFRRPALDLELRENLCEDVPAWWLLKKKKTMYYTGGADARSVRSIMQFMMHPLNPAEAFKKEEETFRDIQAFILSIQPPRFPYPIETELAHKGERLFLDHCARCHGTYGEKWTYPNKIVPIDTIGTDRTRFDGISEKFQRYYNGTWFAREKTGWLLDEYSATYTEGYQAPPLDGLWATAPYLHNGSVPTVYQVLNSKTRPKIFTRSYKTGTDEYDPVHLGWKVRVLDAGADPRLPGIERRKIYDTTQPGRSNAGHTFGDKLNEEERRAVIEYLKTL